MSIELIRELTSLAGSLEIKLRYERRRAGIYQALFAVTLGVLIAAVVI